MWVCMSLTFTTTLNMLCTTFWHKMIPTQPTHAIMLLFEHLSALSER